MGTNVHVKEAVVITPSEPTPSGILTLSSLDSQLFLRFTIEYLLIYRPPGPSPDRRATSARLRSALAQALVPYYPLAGRVRHSASGRLEVSCRAQGAVFIEAVADHAAAQEFEGAPTLVAEWRELLTLHVPDVLKGAPPLVVQLTWLQDGAAALAVGINHCLADGVGTVDFINYFSELSAGKCGTRRPVWERHVFDPKPGRVLPHPEFKRVQDVYGFGNRFKRRLTPTSITLDEKDLRELKRVASGQGESTSYTSFEVLSAHVWRSWARGMCLPEAQPLKLLFSVDVRTRVDPALPAGYYGNAFVLGCAETNARDMLDRGLGHVAGLVRKAKQRIDDAHVRSVVESVSGSRACPDSVGVLILSQWSRLGLERVDFGLGRPVHVAPVCTDRYCLLLPVRDEPDAVKVNVAIPDCSVDKYEYLMRSPYS